MVLPEEAASLTTMNPSPHIKYLSVSITRAGFYRCANTPPRQRGSLFSFFSPPLLSLLNLETCVSAPSLRCCVLIYTNIRVSNAGLIDFHYGGLC